MSLEHLDITLEDRGWPEVQIVVKHGQRVYTDRVRFDQAASKFSSEVQKLITAAIEKQIQRRRNYGT